MPVSGWWQPIVIVEVVMPGAEAVSGVCRRRRRRPPPPLLLDELQAAAARLSGGESGDGRHPRRMRSDHVLPFSLRSAAVERRATRSVQLPDDSDPGRCLADQPARSRPAMPRGNASITTISTTP